MSTLILFDFDGTFADTAPDMAQAANRQRALRSMPPLPEATLRNYVSMGARGMVKISLDIDPDHPEFEQAKQDFLTDYENNCTDQTRLFDGIPELLQEIRQANMQWGIVTNKATRYAQPILNWLNLPDCAVLVCGDTTPHSKPHPLPLLHAVELAGYQPNQCLYVGDDLRDVEAAHAAGMPAVGVTYGYGSELGQPAHTWNADYLADHPVEIWTAVQSIVSNRMNSLS
ncbi:HAD family hydrolase [Orrella sp. 11846]|uniref:HAD family hydrolase n=1 Tax=Orrella sp. 11846 TaxID=3409913 RepID=UPI003B5C2814